MDLKFLVLMWFSVSLFRYCTRLHVGIRILFLVVFSFFYCNQTLLKIIGLEIIQFIIVLNPCCRTPRISTLSADFTRFQGYKRYIGSR